MTVYKTEECFCYLESEFSRNFCMCVCVFRQRLLPPGSLIRKLILQLSYMTIFPTIKPYLIKPQGKNKQVTNKVEEKGP